MAKHKDTHIDDTVEAQKGLEATDQQYSTPENPNPRLPKAPASGPKVKIMNVGSRIFQTAHGDLHPQSGIEMPESDATHLAEHYPDEIKTEKDFMRNYKNSAASNNSESGAMTGFEQSTVTGAHHGKTTQQKTA